MYTKMDQLLNFHPTFLHISSLPMDEDCLHRHPHEGQIWQRAAKIEFPHQILTISRQLYQSLNATWHLKIHIRLNLCRIFPSRRTLSEDRFDYWPALPQINQINKNE